MSQHCIIVSLDFSIMFLEGAFLQPHVGDHAAISRQPSGVSAQSLDDHHSFHLVRQDHRDRSQVSSFSGQFSVDPV